MRDNDDQAQFGVFNYVSLENRIPAAHPLRGVRKLADAVLAEMSKDFDGMYGESESAVDSAGTAVPRVVAAGLLLDPKRAVV